MVYNKFPRICAAVCALLLLSGCGSESNERSQPAEQKKEQKRSSKKKSDGGVRAIEQDAEFDAILKEGKPVVAKFFATWCGPCMAMKSKFHDKAEQHGDTAIFVALDNDKVRGLFTKYGVDRFPTFVYFDAKGKEVKRHTGGGEFDSAVSAFLKKMERP